MSNENLEKITTDLSNKIIKDFEENEKITYQQVRRNFDESDLEFEEVMFEVKKKLEEKGYIFDYTIQTFPGRNDTDTCTAEIRQITDEDEDTENWYD